jgi:hypothetical protein
MLTGHDTLGRAVAPPAMTHTRRRRSTQRISSPDMSAALLLPFVAQNGYAHEKKFNAMVCNKQQQNNNS